MYSFPYHSSIDPKFIECMHFVFCFVLFYRLYYKIFKKSYGASDGTEMINAINDKIISQYNNEVGSVCAKMEQTTGDQLIVAICTPLMKRVHTMVKHSGELVFIDSTGVYILQ